MALNVFTGTIPALMTPCTKRREPDFDALARKGKELVGLGMSKQARGLKRPSKIMSNISGLAIPGTMLAYVERGDGGPTR